MQIDNSSYSRIIHALLAASQHSRSKPSWTIKNPGSIRHIGPNGHRTVAWIWRTISQSTTNRAAIGRLVKGVATAPCNRFQGKGNIRWQQNYVLDSGGP